jgi:hypothetical protein
MRPTITEVLSMLEFPIAADLPALRLKRNEDRRLHAGHLWVFSNEVDTQQTSLAKFKAGELVRWRTMTRLWDWPTSTRNR